MVTQVLTFEKNTLKKGAWSEEEDNKLRAYIQRYGHWNWALLPKFAGLSRSGKSCRLRWMNYLRPNIKRGNFTKEDDDIIVSLHKQIGNKWTAIAAQLPGRSDNEVKNRWNSHLKKRVQDDQTVLRNYHDKTIMPNEAQSSSSSSSSWPLGDLDYAFSNDASPQNYNYELCGDFWTDPFLQDITSLGNTTFSDKLVDNMETLSSVDYLVSQSSWEDKTMSDDVFSWSTLVSYFDFNNY